MDHSIRRHEYNRIKDELRYIEMAIEKSEDSVSRMRHQAETSFSRAQLEKVTAKNIERCQEKGGLEDRLENLRTGLLDDELRKQVRIQMDEADEKTRVTKKKKSDLKADKEAKSVISKAYYIASRRQDRKNKYADKNMDRSYRHFSRACGSVPDYMRRNLREMPNNKGYFWKSVACYGGLPAEKGRPTVLFDRKRGGVMVIHEWTPDEYKIYEKKGKERKILISCTRRRHKELPPICAEVQRREREEAERLARQPRRRTSPSRKSSGRSKWKPKDGSNDRSRGRARRKGTM
jgi:hypothetical protein